MLYTYNLNTEEKGHLLSALVPDYTPIVSECFRVFMCLSKLGFIDMLMTVELRDGAGQLYISGKCFIWVVEYCLVPYFGFLGLLLV